MLRAPIILFLNLVSLVRYALAAPFHALRGLVRSKNRRYVRLDLNGSLPLGRPGGIGRWFRSDVTFLDIRRDIKALANDDSVHGVVFDPSQPRAGSARRADLADTMQTLRQSGKHVVAHAEIFQTSDYTAATAADTILVTPAGRFYTFGPRIEQFYLAGAFRRFGVTAQFVHIGAFKAAASMFVRDKMSVAEAGMFREIHSGARAHVVEQIETRRAVSSDVAGKLFEAPFTGRRGMLLGLCDGEVYEREIGEWLKRHDGVDSDIDIVDVAVHQDAKPRPLNWRSFRRQPKLVIVDLSGFIAPAGMSIAGRQASLTPESVLPLLEQLRNDPRVAGVLLHINSPGGSALAADTIWDAVDRLRAEKPVVAYCGDLAASGGYYIAVAADRIVCRATSIVGSIGVVAGKMSGGEAVDSLGVRTDSIQQDAGAEFLSVTAPISPEAFAMFQQDVRQMYARFLERVGQGRKIERRRLHRYARGRIYLGEQALARGLVDELGGLDRALEVLRGLCDETGDVKFETVYRAHEQSTLRDVISGSALQAANVDSMARLYTVARLFQREPVLMLFPGEVSR